MIGVKDVPKSVHAAYASSAWIIALASGVVCIITPIAVRYCVCSALAVMALLSVSSLCRALKEEEAKS